MWLYLILGMGYGFAAAVQPGPFQTYLVSEALGKGWRRTLPAALAPLISDGPIIILALLVLSRVPDWLQRFLHVAGGLFVLYLAYGAAVAWRDFGRKDRTTAAQAPRSVVKAAVVNVLNPSPYIYWCLVTGPILLAGWREAPAAGLAFLVSFYATIVMSLSAIIIVFGAAGRLGPKVNRALLGVSSVALLCFGLYQVWRGALSIYP